MYKYICEDCRLKGTEYDVYEYGSFRLCSECAAAREKVSENEERVEERLCAIQDTKLAILKQLRTWQRQGLFLTTAIKNLEATLD